MNALAEWILTNLVTYGAPILFVSTYIGSLGIPIPISLIVTAAGAFIRQGVLDWRLAVPICLAGAVFADNSEYWLGRLAETWLTRRFGEKATWQRGLNTFNRQGGWAILLTRFWLIPLAPVVNLVAGSRYPYARFLFFDTLGEALWVLLYGGLGFFFASQWELISQFLLDFSGLSVGLVILAGGIYLFLRWRTRKNHPRR